MKKVLIFILALATVPAFGKKNFDKQNKEILEEGTRLYQSEMASWYGTDVFMERFNDKTKIGGYFSYVENNLAKCLFFSKDEQPKVLGTISFDSTYNIHTADVDLKERAFTAFEASIYLLRQSAMEVIMNDKEEFFRSYKNTNYNIIPLIYNNEKKVYIISSSTQNGVAFLGNDYLLTFKENYQLKEKSKLHQSLIPLDYGQAEGGEIESAIHSHLPTTGPLFTPTDICTLMLYQPFAKWKQHTVVTKDYISIWNANPASILTITKEVMEKISKDQETRHPQ